MDVQLLSQIVFFGGMTLAMIFILLSALIVIDKMLQR